MFLRPAEATAVAHSYWMDRCRKGVSRLSFLPICESHKARAKLAIVIALILYEDGSVWPTYETIQNDRHNKSQSYFQKCIHRDSNKQNQYRRARSSLAIDQRRAQIGYACEADQFDRRITMALDGDCRRSRNTERPRKKIAIEFQLSTMELRNRFESIGLTTSRKASAAHGRAGQGKTNSRADSSLNFPVMTLSLLNNPSSKHVLHWS